MKIAFRFPLLAALGVAFALCSGARAEEIPPACKNHYILRCSPLVAIAWLPAPSPLVDHGGSTATLLDSGEVLVAGGSGAAMYHPTAGAWGVVPPMNVMRRNHGAVRLLDGRVLVVGGDGYLDAAPSSAEIFDPETRSWTPTPALNFHRRNWAPDLTATLLLDGTVLVTGGSDAQWSALGSAEIYDPALNTWRATGSLNEARVGHTATLLADGKVLVIGGVTDWDMWFRTWRSELYDPTAGTWQPVGFGPSVANHTATPLSNGLILVAGGQMDTPVGRAGGMWPYGTTNASSLYDPSTGEFTSIAPLLSKRHNHLAIPLPNGDMLAVGGEWQAMPVVHSFTFGSVQESEWFNASTGSWVGIGQIGAPPDNPVSATPLGDGTVLVIGEGSSAALLKY